MTSGVSPDSSSSSPPLVTVGAMPVDFSIASATRSATAPVW